MPATNTAAVQTAYMIARTAYDTALAEVTRRAPMPGPDADDSTVDAWLDESERAHAELHVDALSAALSAAEDAMLEWSFAVARTTAAGNRTALLAALISIMVESMLSVMPGQAVRAEGKVLAERWTK